jgi:hypothetical protein
VCLEIIYIKTDKKKKKTHSYRAKILGSCRLENLDGERLRCVFSCIFLPFSPLFHHFLPFFNTLPPFSRFFCPHFHIKSAKKAHFFDRKPPKTAKNRSPGSPKAPQNPLFAPKTDPEDEDFTIKIPPFQSWTLNLNLEMAEIGGKNGENSAKNGGKSAENGAKIALEREKFRAAAEEFKRAEKSARSVLEFYAQRGENL